jgi:hypothetical protein
VDEGHCRALGIDDAVRLRGCENARRQGALRGGSGCGRAVVSQTQGQMHDAKAALRFRGEDAAVPWGGGDATFPCVGCLHAAIMCVAPIIMCVAPTISTADATSLKAYRCMRPSSRMTRIIRGRVRRFMNCSVHAAASTRRMRWC